MRNFRGNRSVQTLLLCVFLANFALSLGFYSNEQGDLSETKLKVQKTFPGKKSIRFHSETDEEVSIVQDLDSTEYDPTETYSDFRFFRIQSIRADRSLSRGNEYFLSRFLTNLPPPSYI